MKDVVIVENVKKVFATKAVSVNALGGVSINVEKNAFTAIVGPSGSGKTTLLNLIGGLDSPTEGNIIVNGKDISKLSPRELSTVRLNEIGFIFQSYNLIPVLTVVENVEYIMLLQGVDKKTRRAKVMDVLESVELADYANRRPYELSGGQQQRVAIARAIVAQPSIVLADEPTANLDSNTGEKLMETMRKINEDRGVTFIFSTHDKMVIDYAKSVTRVKDGLVDVVAS